MPKFIPNFGLKSVHNSIVCFPEVRQWRWGGAGWPEQVLGASPGHLNKEVWVPWHLESDLKRESWAPGGTSSWLHVLVGLWEKNLRVDTRNTLRGTWKWEKVKRKSMKGVLISSLPLWTILYRKWDASNMSGLHPSVRDCVEWISGLPSVGNEAGVLIPTFTHHWLRVALGALTLKYFWSPLEKAKQVC